MKKSFKALVLLLLVGLLFTGCSNKQTKHSENNKKATSSNSKKTKKNKTTKTNKDSKKIVTCSGVISEDDLEMNETFMIEFVNNNAKTTSFIFEYKIPKDNVEMIELFKNIDFEEQAKELFSDMGLDSEKFSVKVDKISDTQIKLSLSGDYLELVDAFSEDGEDAEIYRLTDYENVYNNAIKPTAESDNLTCETKEA